ncbi:transposase [Peribacillus sp. TH16]|uniref:transposase n=1 Tax=Peribacillus sp. TH16 TaxID=2798482 RepID=UPI001912ADAB|nr:transposase [Peribacillus sp. TH16]
MNNHYSWKKVLQDLQERGVEEVLLFITDGLKGCTYCLFSIYPDAKYQSYFVYISHNI